MSGSSTDLFRVRVLRDPSEPSAADRLLQTLAHVFRFETIGDELSAAKGTIILGTPDALSASGTVTSFAAPAADEAGGHRCVETEVRFADEDEVAFPFRNRRVRTPLPQGHPPLAMEPFDKVLATTSSGVLWSVRTTDGVQHYRSALPLLAIGEEQALSDAMGGNRFIENLPLMHFLFELSAPRWHAPPLRAAFIFDDPNLHWHTYGYVRYKDVAERAVRENFHAAFAAIPLDAWFTHQPTASIFRQNHRSLSLLIHGNNHGRHELAQAASASGTDALLRQAVQRIEHLESKAGLDVCRVMVPPHGACSGQTLAALPGAGFEAACISPGSLQAHSVNAAANPSLGFFPAENVNGCHVMPRSAFHGSAENAMLVAAYLGRPMILRGHHQDLKGGLDLLDGYARFINGLGNVEWLKLSSLARRSYRFSNDAEVCTLEPRSRRVDFALPPTAAHLRIAAGTDVAADATYTVCVDGRPVELAAGERTSLAGTGAPRVVSVTTNHRKRYGDKEDASVPRTAASLIARRLLTESRDRLSSVLGVGA
ncbi:hypothetical protein [Methylibium sp.]|uniref:hypothetical protein n=1 Tax=Methylibium sp. TaxID=2067992 RepID=UPI00178D7337|nr:hypothetical protein [Methylibium sp.]MBA3589300.1 hypothetical protein [Methylibium sp.]